MLEENEGKLAEAIKNDLGRCEHESYLAEFATCLSEAKEALSSVSKWAKPLGTLCIHKCWCSAIYYSGVSVPMIQMKGMSSAEIQYQPLGVVLIISPWNYPINLCLAPLIGAISAGMIS